MAYETTTVSVENSQAAIRKLLVGYGCEDFQFGESRRDGDRIAAIGFRSRDRAVRMRVTLKPPKPMDVSKKVTRARSKTREDIIEELYEQEARRIWRVLHWNLKTRMEAIAEGVETFEEAFLAHLLDERTGRTIYESLVDDGRVELAAPLLQLESGAT
jgi:hypothetical protein